MSSFRKYPFRCGNQWPDLWGTGSRKFRASGPDPGALGDVLSKIPILDVGVPAITSVYFDWFSGVMQAFIFCMLTVMYIANAAEE